MPKRIIFSERGVTSLESYELDPPKDDEVLVETAFSLMSIGTELTILHQRYAADSHFAQMFSFPQKKTGVQASGHVRAVGSKVKQLRPGAPVFMRMAHGSHQLIRERDCTVVPPSVSLESACWCGLAKTAYRAAWAARPLGSLPIFVVGAGPLGQMLVRWLLAEQVKVFVNDLSTDRLRHAKSAESAQGAGEIVCVEGDLVQQTDEVWAQLGGAGSPVVVDSTGNAAVFAASLEIAAQYGRVILLGDTGFPGQQHLTSAVMTKGLTVQAVHDSHDRDGWTEPRINEKFFELVAKERFALDGLITHTYAPAGHKAAYQMAEENRGLTMGIQFDWSQV